MVDTFLLTVSPYDRDAAAVVPVYFSNVDYRTAPTDTPASVLFEGVLEDYVFERSAFAPGSVGGVSLPGRGSVRLGIPQQWRDNGRLADLLGYAWDGRTFRLERIPAGSDYADRVTIASGTAARLDQAGPSALRLQFHDRAEDFRRPVQSSRYAGTGGFEGGDNLAERPRPLVFGRVSNAPTILVDPVNLWFDVHAGQIQAIDAVRDNGVALTPSGANPPAAGSYYVDLTNGRIRLGDDPVGAVTVDVKGAAPGGVWKDDLADVVRHVVTVHGGLSDPSELDTDAFTAIATARPGVIGYATGGAETTIAEVLDALVGGAGGYWLFTRGDLFSLAVLAAPTATAATDAAIVAEVSEYRVAEGSLSRRIADIPPSEIRAQYRILGLAQSRDELAGSLSPADRETWSTPFRVAVPTDTATLAAIAAAHLRAVPLEVATYAYDEADAVTVANALLSLLDGLALYSGETDQGFGVIAVGDQVWLSHSDYALASGVAARVLGFTERLSGLVLLEVATT